MTSYFKYSLSIFLVSLTKIFSQVLFRIEVKELNFTPKKEDWDKIKIIIFLNHTSLFEPLFTGYFSFRAIATVIPRLLIPGANNTLRRPIVGTLLKVLFPNMVPITRKRDHSWSQFLNMLDQDKVIGIAPEGRMKRRTGLDKEGRPMSIKGGVAEIIKHYHSGEILIIYSGGLHHVQAPGELSFRPFQKISAKLEKLDIKTYKESLNKDDISFERAVIKDLSERMKKNTPTT